MKIMALPTNSIYRPIQRDTSTQATLKGSETNIGNYRGGKISIIKSQDIDDFILSQRFLAAAGLGDGIDKKALSERKVQVEQVRQLITPERIKVFDQGIAKNAASAKLATEYLRAMIAKSNLPKPENNISSLMQHYMGLQKLANALKGGDDNFIALLTPSKGNPSTLEEFAKNLQEAGDDPEKLASLLEEIDLSPEEAAELPALLKTLRFNPKELKQKLRQSQNLPSPKDLEDFKKSENKSILECVENELGELERTFGGRIYASLNALESAGQSDDGLTFLESYNDVVHGQEGFAQAFMHLLEHYHLAELKKVLPLMKQSIADDLASDQRSTDEKKLHHLLNNMSDMHISEALIQNVQDLGDALKRIFHASAVNL